MRLISGIPASIEFKNGCVLTIGNFDGVHLGHKAVIAKLVARTKELGLPVVIMLFEPQPLEYFQSEKAPARLTRLREKVNRLTQLPIDDLVVVRFNKTIADLEPLLFIQQVLVNSLNVKYLVVGDDFRFGKARQGDFNLLKEQGEKWGFNVEDTGSFQIAEQRVSSTLVRLALADGDLKQAAAMLGYDYALCGRIVHGDKRGRKMGYPTANIKLQRRNLPVNGVFAVTMVGIGGMEYQGVANIGIRPTVDGSEKVLLEAHLFDFDQDIYGHYVTINFKYKIRSEQRFSSIEELKLQIVEDVADAKQFFAAIKNDNGL